MLALERRNEILKLFQKTQTVTVSELSQQFGVTVETIRRDLERLETAGHIVRTHGGAMLTKRDMTKVEQSSSIRKQTNPAEKALIADIIADMVRDGDGIMLDDSSTSLFAARALRGKHRLTVITNSLEVIMDLANVPDWTVMGTGGVLKERSMSFVGNQAETMLSKYHVDKAIISCKGLDLDHGFTESSEPSALVKRCMINSAKEVILAVDSSKFDIVSFVQIGQLNKLSAIVTDKAPRQEWLDALEERGITCLWPDES